MRKVLAGAGIASIVLAGCAATPSTETFTGSLNYRWAELSDGNFWQIEQGPLTGGALFSSKCMVPEIGTVSKPAPKDKGCNVILRVHGKVYTFAGRSNDLLSGTYKGVSDKSTLVVTLVSSHRLHGSANGVAEIVVDFKH